MNLLIPLISLRVFLVAPLDSISMSVFLFEPLDSRPEEDGADDRSEEVLDLRRVGSLDSDEELIIPVCSRPNERRTRVG